MYDFKNLMAGCLVAVGALFASKPASADEWDDLLGRETLQKIDAAAPAKASAKPKKPRKVLVFTESKKDFDRMASQKAQKPVPHKSAPYAAKAVAQMGKKTGAFEATIEANPDVFKKDLSQYDAIVLANVFLEDKLFKAPRDFTKEEENRFTQQQKALVDYVKGGGGLVGIHLAAAEALGWPEFNKMLGGTYAGQAWQAFDKIPVAVEDTESPLNAAFGGRGFTVKDDIYMFREPSLREDIHVLSSVDTGKAPKSIWAERPDGDYPLSWVKKYGDGRVFYTALGHEPDMYLNQSFLAHLLAGIQFAAGDLETDTSPGKPLPVKKGAGQTMEGWTPLFDGKNLDAFKADEGQKKHWIVDDGLIRYDGRGKTLWTKEPFADFRLRVDWRLPRVADSGVFLRGTGKGQMNIWCWDQGSGELWGYQADPKVNADKPVGEWNTFLATMKGDRLTLEVNGREVFTGQQLKGIPKSGPIALQQHGDPIEWKNIYVKKLSGKSGAEKAEGTRRRVEGILNMVEKILDPQRLRDIAPERLSYYKMELRKRGRSENTIGCHLAHLKAALRWAARNLSHCCQRVVRMEAQVLRLGPADGLVGSRHDAHDRLRDAVGHVAPLGPLRSAEGRPLARKHHDRRLAFVFPSGHEVHIGHLPDELDVMVAVPGLVDAELVVEFSFPQARQQGHPPAQKRLAALVADRRGGKPLVVVVILMHRKADLLQVGKLLAPEVGVDGRLAPGDPQRQPHRQQYKQGPSHRAFPFLSGNCRVPTFRSVRPCGGRVERQ